MVGTSVGIVVRRFREDGYTAVFNPKSGFFARVEDPGLAEPMWAQHGPELLDIAITNWCDEGCFFCYRKSDEAGHHMAIADYRTVMQQARELGVFQVALGGGNPNQHPQFAEILRLTRTEYGIVPNYTTNGKGLTDEVLEATKQYCGAVAVSAYPPYRQVDEAIERLKGVGVTVNVHFVVSSKSVGTAIGWLESPPTWLLNADAIVFLNYKPVGRVADDALLLNRSPRMEEFFRLATTGTHPFGVGFDTCTITGLARLGNVNPMTIEGCDAGRFSLFVSESLQVYPCSFMVEAGYDGVSLRERALRDIWANDSSFTGIRDKHQGSGCGSCQTREHCLGGCPIFPKMNLCPGNCSSPEGCGCRT